MNIRMILRVLGLILLIFSGLLLLPLAAALWFREPLRPLLVPVVLSGAVGFLLSRVPVKTGVLFARDGFVIVALGWVLFSLLGALPYYLSRSLPGFIDCLFEAASGLTTTGSTVLTDFEGMPRGVMFWRLFSHWIGGMGVLVFLMAVLPMSGSYSMHIFRAEVPGPTKGKLVPKARQTARVLYLIYIGLTALMTLFLLLGGMSFYDALLHAFATAGTGGFSTNPGSIGGFQSGYIETVCTVFMLLFGVNFNLYFLILIGRWKDALKNEELHVFIGLVVGSAVFLALSLRSVFGGFFPALHQSFFNVATIMSTTGFGTVDFTHWPEYCKWLLVLLMFCGGCAGSTSGGMKLSRLMILSKTIRVEIRQMTRPRSVQRVEMDGRRVENSTIRAAAVFSALYMSLLLTAAFLLSFDGFDIATCFTASLSCLSNVGPGMTELIGPAGSFAVFSERSKLIMTLAMLMGRLELYPILILFSPKTWKK